MAVFTVPFTVWDLHHKGYAERKGILSFDGARLEIQIRSGARWFDLKNTKIENLSFPLDKIAAVEFQKGFFNHKLSIRFVDLETAAALPNADSGEVELTVKRKHKSMALDLVAQAQMDLADHRLSRLTEGCDEPAEDES